MKYYYYIPISGTIILVQDLIKILDKNTNHKINWNVFISATSIQVIETVLLIGILKHLF